SNVFDGVKLSSNMFLGSISSVTGALRIRNGITLSNNPFIEIDGGSHLVIEDSQLLSGGSFYFKDSNALNSILLDSTTPQDAATLTVGTTMTLSAGTFTTPGTGVIG